MPDVYVELSHRVLHSPVSKLIHWAENNAAVAANHAILNTTRRLPEKAVVCMSMNLFSIKTKRTIDTL